MSTVQVLDRITQQLGPAMEPSLHHPKVVWFGPYYSGTGYGTESNAFLLV